jgi:hypothetical protein
LDTATACLARGDNACVIAALDGQAKSAREFELLIETLRAMGRSHDAQQHMATYLARFPDERRSSTYKRLLDAQRASEELSAKAAAAPSQGAPAAPPAPPPAAPPAAVAPPPPPPEAAPAPP